MWERNLGQKIALIAVATLISAWLLFFKNFTPGVYLRGGLDIEGGVAMIFEINDEGVEDNPNLAEDMKTLLQKRVDPSGIYDLNWRVLGRNRLEVQMPLPPKGAKELRDAYAAAQDALFSSILKLSDLERAMRLPADVRAAELEKLAAGSPDRLEKMRRAAERHDAYRAALEAQQRGAGTETTEAAAEIELRVRDAQESYEDAVDDVFAGNFDTTRFQDLLAMDADSPIRKTSLDELKTRFPTLQAQIDGVVARHDAWRRSKGFLDGPADLQRLLKGAGVLEFRILAEPSPENFTKYARYREQLKEFGPRPRPGDAEGWFKIDNPLAFFNLQTPSQLAQFDPQSATEYVIEKYGNDFFVLAKLGPEDGLLHTKQTRKWQLKNANIARDRNGRLCVNFELDVVGGVLFGELTGRNIGKQLCIIVDDVAYSSARINSRITSRGEITGEFSIDKVQYLVQTMQAGALPARLKDTPLSERVIGSSLGEQNRIMATRAAIWGTVATMVVMAVYYLSCGMVANAALMLNVLLVLAAMSLLEARINLAGIAGVILTVGIVVDSNVLIYERMREEKERGASLRMIIKNGYDKAFSTIVDANITTLLTCVIIYYVGSEEIKGFGLTLGWGIVMGLFTSLFVTRTVFTTMVKYGMLKDITMLKLIGVPRIDWYAKRKFFVPLSLILVVLGLIATFVRGRDGMFDIEFNGGVSAEIELTRPTTDEREISRPVREAAARLASKAGGLQQAQVEAAATMPDAFRIRVPNMTPFELEAALLEPLEDENWLRRGGVDTQFGEGEIEVQLNPGVTVERLQEFVRAQSAAIKRAGENLERANINIVLEGPETDRGRFWNLTTTEKNKRVVRYVLEEAMGNRLQRRPRIAFTFRGDNERPYPITDSRLERVIPGLPSGAGADLTDYRGGAAMWFENLSPPRSIEQLRTRLKDMRLQPGYQDYPFRPMDIIGVTPTGEKNADGHESFSSVVVVVADPIIRYHDDPASWQTNLAQKELDFVTGALDSEQSLRKVSQFKPQIAAQATTRAAAALILSWLMIIAYLWVRFGRPAYGIAGVVALVHDVLIIIGLVGISGFIGGAANIGGSLLIDAFKIDMTVIAALLTIIGYSINDTIVIFDRIREAKGRLIDVSPRIINDAINQTMARTIMTGVMTLIVLLSMYLFGGSSIRAFNYCMIAGVIVGTYSSVAIAAPLLLFGAKVTESRAPLAAAPATT